MTTWVAGQDITAAALNDHTPVTLSGSVTPAASFSVSAFNAVNVQGTTFVQVELSYSGSTITATAAGKINPGLLCCTLPYAPPFESWFVYLVTARSAGSLSIRSDGTVLLQTLFPSQTLSSGDTVFFSAPLPTG